MKEWYMAHIKDSKQVCDPISQMLIIDKLMWR
jgi:hypothetical protein